jgi:hypothetical protein
MIEASAHMCACEIVVGVIIATMMDPVTGALPHAATIGLTVVVCVFIAGHAWGWGPMPWLVCSEVRVCVCVCVCVCVWECATVETTRIDGPAV